MSQSQLCGVSALRHFDRALLIFLQRHPAPPSDVAKGDIAPTASASLRKIYRKCTLICFDATQRNLERV